MNMKNNRKGFTTVELVIVIAVIAILATVLIPTFSNMINQANLSTDKQNVRNMNMVLLTYMIEGTEDFGDVRNQLIGGGYKTGEKFAPKTEGYRYLWYSEKNVVLLVDEKNQVVYPEDYIGLETRPYDVNKTPNNPDDDIEYNVVEDIRLCFDLNLPAMLIDKVSNPKDDSTNEPIKVTDDITEFTDLRYENMPLTMKYTFDAEDEGAEYSNWIADFYVSVDLPASIESKIAAGGDPVVLSIAGHYDWYTDMKGIDWVPITLPFYNDLQDIGLLRTYGEGEFTYDFVYNTVKSFDCGIVNDELGGPDQGVKLTVEIRITESEYHESSDSYTAKENGEIKVLGIFEYTYK